MTQPIDIKGIKLGEGRPKTIISLMGAKADENIELIKKGIEAGVECFEWRGDFAADVHDPQAMAQQSIEIGKALSNNPYLFTFRSISQGGHLTIPVEEYAALNKAIIEAEAVDLVDIETWIGDPAVLELVECAKQHNVKTVISYHNFAGTPSVEWMVNLLTHMADLGADIPKIATMANSAQDALKLLAATEEMSRIHSDKPLLTMAMGREGSITRLVGELFGSAITFCSLEEASAPGQVQVMQAIRIMDELHKVYG
mgnify:FL=1